MILPTKIIKPADSLIVISSYVLALLKTSEKNIDSILYAINEIHYKKIKIEKLLLCLDFLFLIGKIEIENAIVKIRL